jgi:hypothetical protein
MQVAFVLPLSMPLVAPATTVRLNWFFPEDNVHLVGQLAEFLIAWHGMLPRARYQAASSPVPERLSSDRLRRARREDIDRIIADRKSAEARAIGGENGYIGG